MNILFDINIILDAFLERKPFDQRAVFLMDAVEKSVINGFLCADSVTTLYYLIQKAENRAFAQKKIELLLEIFEIAPINRAVLEDALTCKFRDYEDAVVYQSAAKINADGIVTRNSFDYKKSKIPVFSPSELIYAITESR